MATRNNNSSPFLKLPTEMYSRIGSFLGHTDAINPNGSPRRQLKRLLVAGFRSASGVNILQTREILETIVTPHSPTIETIFIADDVDFAPVGGHQNFNTHQKAIDHLVTALAGMPSLRRVAFPVIEFRVEGAERQDDKNFERPALGTAMTAIAGGVLTQLPRLEHVAFWSLWQNCGVHGRRIDGVLYFRYHHVPDDWVKPLYGTRERWPMGLWGYRW
ncbi:hypothetical protein QBC40DRAFT_259812 [Triangularia verruculosa]|uniref:Uncharacterized protein n=1 Tax=Triangularia verruculosa TaxID=2587418 RepID=A0AAN7APH8_9PEZI|nr:hypothetical protein QBC40DRAFT_259812 [Triangularia verruculosa]